MIADYLLLYNITHESHPCHVWVSPWLSCLLVFVCSVWGACWERRNVWVTSTVATVTGCVFCEVENTGDHCKRRRHLL